MSDGLYRKQALESHSTRHVRGGILQISPPWAIGIYLSLTVIFLLALAIAAFGSLRIYASGRGVVRPSDKVLILRAPLEGTIESLEVAAGAAVEPHQPLLRFDDYEARVEALSGAEVDTSVWARQAQQLRRDRLRVRAPLRGIVDQWSVRPGQYVEAGDVLGTLVPAASQLIGYLAVPEKDRAYLEVGRPVRLRFDSYPYHEMGVGRGRVTRIGEDLLGPRQAAELGLEGQVARGSVVLEVTVLELPPRAQRPRLRNGMFFSGDVVLRDQPIYALFLKPLADVLNR